MTALFSFRTAGDSHVGKVRTLNEDAWLARPEIGLWAVADGMGGHGGGDVASRAVATSLQQMPAPVSAAAFLADFEARIGLVNADLIAQARASGRTLIGATLAAVLIFDSHFACVWCGDSRVYRLRAGELAQVSRDHSEVQDLIDRGVTRALGAAEQAELEIIDGPVVAGDRFLLCSDGLTGHVEDEEIAALLARDDPKQACAELIALTLQRGAKDNVSVVIVVCDADNRTIRSDGAWMREIVSGT